MKITLKILIAPFIMVAMFTVSIIGTLLYAYEFIIGKVGLRDIFTSLK